MIPITGPLADLFPDTVTVRSTTRDTFGKITGYGPTQVLRARCVGQHRTIRDLQGREHRSSVVAIFNGVFSLTTEHEYTLPTRFNPNRPPALSVETETDENGPHHETVMF